MRQPAATWFMIAIGAAALAACSTPTVPQIDPNLYPADFKKEILNTLTRTLGYPTKVRDAFIADPVLVPIEKDQRYAACVRYNARDTDTHYMGSADHIAYFLGGHLNQLVPATKEQCGKAAYRPFPELEKACFAEKCV